MPPRGKPYHRMTPGQKSWLTRQIKQEIKERDKPGRLFLPTCWRKYRLEGYLPDQIDYDMCHVFR